MTKSNLENRAKQVGLYIAAWHPGDKMRYKFFEHMADYDEGTGIYIATSRKEAAVFISGYAAGKGLFK